MTRRSHHERLCDREDRIAEHEATYTLSRQIAEARKSMGEFRWAKLNEEFEHG